jgi:nucleotide-binding universal stress UspA family protein
LRTPPKKILLATDGSGDAALAARAAIDLSNKAGAELHVVHVWTSIPPTAYPAMSVNRHAHLYEAGARELLETEVKRVRESGGTVEAEHLREGRPPDEIAALADELAADLIVVGSRGAGPVKRLVTGSVSEGVVALASCPVLVVRGEGSWPPARVIVGDDSSGAATRAGGLGVSLAELFGASVVLVRVYPPQLAFRTDGASETPAISEEVLKMGDKSLRRRVESLQGRPDVRGEVGDAAAIIQRIAEESGEKTLVALGSRGLDAVRRFTLGSVSTDVLRVVEGPVLIVNLPEESES